MNVYVVKGKYTASYKSRKGWTDDLQKARLFNRICDAKNSLTKTQKADLGTLYEVVKLCVSPCVKNYKVSAKINTHPAGFQPQIFNSEAQAKDFILTCTKKYNLHSDYFPIQMKKYLYLLHDQAGRTIF
jgi:hypothetical protein